MTNTVAIVPMRHNSERVPGKNYRPLAGIPLYHHVVRTLSAVDEIDTIVIDTDSDFIIDDCAEHFPLVRVLLRPEHLRDGNIAMNDVLLNTLDQVDADTVLQTHSTNPFLKADTVSSALRSFAQSGREFDSVFSVTRLQARLWDAETQPVNHNPAVLLRTQDLPPLFIENSCFFIFTPELLRERGNRIGARPHMFEMSALEAVDIDTEEDFALASAIAHGNPINT
ncbi:CMP-N-acetylneuraminic acid synthetase [Mycolicibacterium sp. BK556]|uniref:acylneuraminate cytidylyltransferase family protein n=1 Tax=Mycobacteriaceae TaxID=1762 RepID=UPI00105E5F44|nr:MULTISPECIES: acylneuraminate cytidylyltransferase family protein [Mycobacteriaceae]MBB3607020.1 CMP-N-acetylneuraminic acid synthetase [Mycolicibacterium sp. BK556]MBB3636767.1 CMP-N-acetylneuraminic acid synthetase [Mycolicibacterium sp. BK607]MBB3747568.1 CMP-N-acetylneuraminic acid synthetase [Mycolicibacterium sp. BK634]TDO08294.1 CMP-N-acetylneuraminic acid synthetase [Mycobacterium sp. BK086]